MANLEGPVAVNRESKLNFWVLVQRAFNAVT